MAHKVRLEGKRSDEMNTRKRFARSGAGKSLDRINKINRIMCSLSLNPVNPVNPGKNYMRKLTADDYAVEAVTGAKALVANGILSREGLGRSTHYVLA